MPNAMKRRSDAPMPRWAVGALVALAWLAIMVPLGVVVIFAERADDRAERAVKASCENAVSNRHLAETLDRGLRLLLAEGEAADVARRELTRTVTEGLAEAEQAIEECRR